jgi:hypothetical protein
MRASRHQCPASAPHELLIFGLVVAGCIGDVLVDVQSIACIRCSLEGRRDMRRAPACESM